MTDDPTPPPHYPEGSIGAYQRTSGTAIASLVLGILGFVMLPLVGSIAAVILGKSAQKEIERTPELEGEGFASAGIILGWIGIALAVAAFLLLVLAVACVASTDISVS